MADSRKNTARSSTGFLARQRSLLDKKNPRCQSRRGLWGKQSRSVPVVLGAYMRIKVVILSRSSERNRRPGAGDMTSQGQF